MDDPDFFPKICSSFNVSRETFEKLVCYKKLLIKWQKKINLVSRGTLESFWIRHVLDSLQIIEYINGKRVLDIGSGAGFPGMIIALCSDFEVTCVDSDGRKIVFLEEVARITGATVNIKNIRIEQLEDYNFDTVCSRGFSSLVELISLTSIFSRQKYGIFLKGARVHSELLEAKKFFDFEYNIVNSKSDSTGCVVMINEIFGKVKHKIYEQNI